MELTGWYLQKRIDSVVEITGNNSLVSLNGLNALTGVGSLDIAQNPILNDLQGLSQINSVSHDVFFYNNSSITSLDGLSDIISLSSVCFIMEDVYITDNPSLCASDAENLVNTIQTCIGGGIEGTVTIENNAVCP